MPVKLIKYSYFQSDAKAIHSMKSQKELSEDNAARRAAIITKQKSWLKFVKSMWELQSQGHEVKNYSTMWKAMSQGIHMYYMKTTSLLVRK